MGFLDVLLGRTKPVAPNLDVLFAIPSAAYTLQAALNLSPTGNGSVCFKAAEGPVALQAQADIRTLLAADTSLRSTQSRDEYGFTWVSCQRPDGDLAALVTDLHTVNTTLAEVGFGPSLLCTTVGFVGAADDDQRRLALVYLYKRGTVYPFAPSGGHIRDTTLEMEVRARLRDELPIENDLARWFPLWDGPEP
jgi:hypothetical protein